VVVQTLMVTIAQIVDLMEIVLIQIWTSMEYFTKKQLIEIIDLRIKEDEIINYSK